VGPSTKKVIGLLKPTYKAGSGNGKAFVALSLSLSTNKSTCTHLCSLTPAERRSMDGT